MHPARAPLLPPPASVASATRAPTAATRASLLRVPHRALSRPAPRQLPRLFAEHNNDAMSSKMTQSAHDAALEASRKAEEAAAKIRDASVVRARARVCARVAAADCLPELRSLTMKLRRAARRAARRDRCKARAST